MTNATLIYLFRPSTNLHAQTPNPNIPATGSVHLHNIVSSYTVSPTLQTILPTLIPLLTIGLTASHGYIILKWVIEQIAERVLWRGSREEAEIQRLTEKGSKGLSERVESLSSKGRKRGYNDFGNGSSSPSFGGFWNGGEEGARAIGSVGKVE